MFQVYYFLKVSNSLSLVGKKTCSYASAYIKNLQKSYFKRHFRSPLSTRRYEISYFPFKMHFISSLTKEQSLKSNKKFSFFPF